MCILEELSNLDMCILEELSNLDMCILEELSNVFFSVSFVSVNTFMTFMRSATCTVSWS